MMDSQLMGEFECDVKDLEADSWSSTVDKKFLKTLKKDEVKRQDVIYGKMCKKSNSKTSHLVFTRGHKPYFSPQNCIRPSSTM